MSVSRLLMEPEPAPQIEWEESPCPLCASDDYRAVVEAPDHGRVNGLRFLVVQCQKCGLAFTNPRPSPASIAQFYDDDYKPHRPPATDRQAWWHRLLPRPRGKGWRKALPLHGQGRLLDFGCGNGGYLTRMQRLGWKATGIDLSQPSIERLHTQFGLNVFHGSLPHPALADESFDVITMWQSLEHVHQPLDVLRAGHRLLAPGGRIVVAVHNIESLPFRWFGPDWFALDLPRHLTHFSPTTLQLMLEHAGFKPGRAHMVRHSSWLRQSARRAQRGRWRSLLRTRLGSNLASWYCFFVRMSDSILVSAHKT